jgi:Tol biopolymer transport system component
VRQLVITAAAITVATIVLGAAVPTPAVGAMPGRNGALLIAASTDAGDECAPPGPPRVIGSSAGDPVCEEAPPYARFLADPPRSIARWLDGDRWAAGTFLSDGSRVLLNRRADDRLHVGSLARTRPVPLRYHGRSPAASADGRLIAFVDDSRDSPAVFVARLEGGRARRLAAGSSPRWSSNGRVAFTGSAESEDESGGPQVMVTDVGATRVRAVMRPGKGESDLFYDWSPNGRELLVARMWHRELGAPKSRSALYAVSMDGRTTRRLTSFSNYESYAESFADAALWSPDGRQIAFLRGGVYMIASHARSPQGWRSWHKVLTGVAELHDWQSLH